jgi:16S rRNA processing protein RimM
MLLFAFSFLLSNRFEMELTDCFYIGYITKTRGLKGEVQVYFEYEDPAALTFPNLFIELNGKLVPFFVSSFKLQQNHTAYFNFEDIDSIGKASALVRKKLYLPNSAKPERDEDEFGYEDLEGFIVQDKRLGELGEIIEVREYPQQFIAVVSYKFREIMFPLNGEFILGIDEEEGILEVDLPEGLIEVYLGE